jgi:flagellar motor protein MotB
VRKEVVVQKVEPFRLPEVFAGNLPFHGVPVSDLPPDEGTVMAANAAPASPANIEPAAGEKKKDLRDRITIVEMSSAAFFDSGSAVLSSGGKSILFDVAATLKSDRYRDYAATVEGHTDDAPISTPQFPSNWELSSARAASVVRYLIEQGVAAGKLRAAGYADTFPKAPNHDEFGNKLPENQAKNRRVAIKLEKIEAP